MAVRRAMKAEGTFVAINNGVSQSVPHFHVHIVRGRKETGCEVFFWPRTKYGSDKEAAAIADAIREEIGLMQSS